MNSRDKNYACLRGPFSSFNKTAFSVIESIVYSGSMDLHMNSDAVTRVELRRTRLELIRQEYEDDIVSLQNTIDRLKIENKRLHERISEQDKTISALHMSASQRGKDGEGGAKVCSDIDMLLKLTAKLQEASTTYEQLRDDMTKTKEENKKLREENDMLLRQIARMKDEMLFSKSPQRFGRYTISAMQTKVSQYEKEIQLLRKALTRSDQYIKDLNSRLDRRTPDTERKKTPDTARRVPLTAKATSTSSAAADVAETSSGSRRSSFSLEGVVPGGTGDTHENGLVNIRRVSSNSDVLSPPEPAEDDRPTMVPVCSFPSSSTSALNSYTSTSDMLTSTLSEAASTLESANQWLRNSPSKPDTPTDRTLEVTGQWLKASPCTSDPLCFGDRNPDVFYKSESTVPRPSLDSKLPMRNPFNIDPSSPFSASRQLMLLSERARGRQSDTPRGRQDLSAPSPTSSDGGKLPRTLDFDVLVEGSMNEDSPQRLESLSPRVEVSTGANDMVTVSASATLVATKIKMELEEPDGETQAKKVKLEKDHLFHLGHQ
ncbi:predicted protein [Nematostella vectensis]|uniref:Uncharacterized protein n=1 Tax=Nematostella vectensis TaxID=45351 RepID=A7RNB9_NEMVE|nr:predicted protein [Nematostella vectensis]|eukprot:XP_001639098.1 predicted protein [Nematostella vectensis]